MQLSLSLTLLGGFAKPGYPSNVIKFNGVPIKMNGAYILYTRT